MELNINLILRNQNKDLYVNTHDMTQPMLSVSVWYREESAFAVHHETLVCTVKSINLIYREQ